MTKKAFVALADKHGIEVDFTPAGKDSLTHAILPAMIEIESPEGHRFADTDIHVDCSCGQTNDKGSMDWSAAKRHLEQIVSAGFVKCDDNCEWCYP